MTMLTLTPDELQQLTGYIRPSRQLAELQRQGFARARLNRVGQVVLERDHYTAVVTARLAAEAAPPHAPMLQPVTRVAVQRKVARCG